MASWKAGPLARVPGLAGVAVLALVGCGIDEAAPLFGDQQEEPIAEAATPAVTINSPVLDHTIPTRTCARRVAIAGASQPGASVVVSGGATAGDAVDVADGQTGRFCIPLALAAGDNLIEVRARAKGGDVESDAVRMTITQEACPQGPADAPEEADRAINVARDAVVESSDPPDEGSLDMLTDGDLSRSVKFTGGGGSWWQPWDYGDDYDGWILVRLDRPYALGSITVHWGEQQGTGGDYGQQYDVLINQAASPSLPDPENAEWVRVAEVKKGDGGVDSFPLEDKAIVAHHVALWLEANGETGNKESFKLNEIEVTSPVGGAAADAEPAADAEETLCGAP